MGDYIQQSFYDTESIKRRSKVYQGKIYLQEFCHGANDIDKYFEDYTARKHEELKTDTKGTYQSRVHKRREAIETWRKTADTIKRYGSDGI